MTELDYIRQEQSFDWYNRKTINLNNKLELDEIPIANNWIDEMRVTTYVKPIQASRVIEDVEVLERQRAEEYGLKVDVNPEDIIKDLSQKMVTVFKYNLDGSRQWNPRSGELITEQRSLLDVARGDDVNRLRDTLQLLLTQARINYNNGLAPQQQNVNNLGAIVQAFATQLLIRRGILSGDPQLIQQSRNMLQLLGAPRGTMAEKVSFNELTMTSDTGLDFFENIFGKLNNPDEASERLGIFIALWSENPNIEIDLNPSQSPDELEKQLKDAIGGRQIVTQAINFESDVGIGSFLRQVVQASDETVIPKIINSIDDLLRALVDKDFTRDAHRRLSNDIFELIKYMTKARLDKENADLQQTYRDIENDSEYGPNVTITKSKIKDIFQKMIIKAKELDKPPKKTAEEKEKEKTKEEKPVTGEQNMIEDVNKILDDNNKTNKRYELFPRQFIGGTKLTKTLFVGSKAVFKVGTLKKILKYMQDNRIHRTFFQYNDMSNPAFELDNLNRAITAGNKILVFKTSEKASLIAKNDWQVEIQKYTEFGAEK